jgi:hypothetical protein
MGRSNRTDIQYAALRKDCLEKIHLWPGCETVSGIRLIRDASAPGFTVQVTLYGNADRKLADRAMITIERVARRQYRLVE